MVIQLKFNQASGMDGLYHCLLIVLCKGALSADWCYQSQITCSNTCKGPEEWPAVAKDCGNMKQSPINIVTKRVVSDGRLTPIRFQGYQESFRSVMVNNGHSAQVNLSAGAKIHGARLEATYKALQLHLHWGNNGGPGSEHTIDGEKYPMELHIVHIKENYNSLEQAVLDPSGVAVLGFFYEESESSNKKYEPIINALNNITLPGTDVVLSVTSLDMLIPSHESLRHYFRYQGSLTTPGCSEAVVWTIFEKTIPLSKSQLSAFSSLKFQNGTAMVNTFRPVQLRFGRDVYYSTGYVICASATFLLISVLTTLALPV